MALDQSERDLLIRIDERVTALKLDLVAIHTAVLLRMDAQDVKIGKLPGWKHVVIGGGATISAIGGALLHMLTRKP